MSQDGTVQDTPKYLQDVCLHYTCTKPKPEHSIVWKCVAAHRTELRYCGVHISQMQQEAHRYLKSDKIRLLCPVCHRPMYPVLEAIIE